MTDDPRVPSSARSRRHDRLRLALGLLWLAAILALTLRPGAAPDPAGGPDEVSAYCILCGSYGLADFIRNVVFFAPLGFVAAPWLGVLGSGLAVTALSLGIEITQVFVPGRYATLGDLLANGAGGLLGAALALEWRRALGALVAPGPTVRRLVTGVAAALLLAPALTFRPGYPDRIYYFQWTADLGGRLAPYRGELLQAEVDGRAAPQGRVDDTREWLIGALQSTAPIDLRFVVGPEPPGVAPVFSIYDDLQREMLLIGVDGADVVVRRRQVAGVLRLEQPVIRWPGALRGTEPGDTVDLAFYRVAPMEPPAGRGTPVPPDVGPAVSFSRQGHTLCLETGGNRRCDLAPGLEAGWSLLYAPEGAGRGAVLTLGFVWCLLLGSVVGLGSSRATQAAGLGVVLFTLAYVVTWLSPHLSFHPLPLLGILAGGWSVARVAPTLRSTAVGGRSTPT